MTNATRSHAPRTARSALIVLVGLVVGALIALGFSSTAFAIQTVHVTIKVVNKAGAALPTSTVSVLHDEGGVVPYGDLPIDTTAVTGKPGYFTAILVVGDTYTLAIIPTGTSLLDGNEEFMGGGQDLAQADTFVPSSTNAFVTATFATEGVITGKVTSPTGVPLKDAEAEDFVLDGGQWIAGSYTTTNASGVYTLTDLQPGSYALKFFSATNAWPPVYSGNATTLDSATPVSVLPGRPAVANARFASYTGSIAGTALVTFYYSGETIAAAHAIATAYPVLTESGGDPATYDLGAAVSSAPANSNGAWTIGNLTPGNYVVMLQPFYYNESNQWVGTDSATDDLSQATIFTVTAGHRDLATPTYLYGQDGDFEGADPYIEVETGGAGHWTDAFGQDVQLTSDADGLVYLSGTTDGSSMVPLYWGDGSAVDNDLTPGWYTVTITDPNQQYEPFIQDVYFAPDEVDGPALIALLTTVTDPPGFSGLPTIAQTDLQVGTTYTVSGQAATRSDAVLSYQWLRDGAPIYEAGGASYVSTGADVGHQLSVRVTASSFGFDNVSVYASVQGGDETAGSAPTNNGAAPSISPATGAAFVGTTLQADPGGWSATGLHFDYQWQSNGVDVGTDSSSYVVGANDVDEPITVTVTATKTGYDDSDAVVSPVSVTPAIHPAPIDTKAPVVTKAASHGTTTFSATSGTWSVAGLTYSYDWTAGSTDLGTAAKFSTTTPTWTDPLELTVTTTEAGYLQGSKTVVVQRGTEAFTQTVLPAIQDVTTGTPISTASDPVQVGDQLAVSSHADWTLPSEARSSPTATATSGIAR